MQATIVFQKIWEAVHAKNVDGGRKYKYIILTGSSRSSKTYSILQSHHLQALTNRFRISIWRETKKDTKDTVLADFRKALPTMPNYNSVSFNKTESIFTYPNGATIEIAGGDDEEKVHGFQQDIAHFNEPYGISKATFDQIDMRTSEYILIDWNPRQNHWIDKVSKLDNAIVIHSTFKDNPFVPVEQRIKILSYQPIKYAEVVRLNLITEPEAKLYDFEENPKNFSSKQLKELQRTIYNESKGIDSEFDWQVYGLGEKAENPKKIYHNWKSIKLAEYLERSKSYQKYYGLDYGFANPTACVEVAYDGDLTFYVRLLLYKPMRHLSAALGETLTSIGVPSGPVTYIWADSADREAGSDISITNDLRTNYALNAVPTNKPTYKARFEFINKAKIVFVDSPELQNEYDNYQYEYIQGIPTERPIKKDDHAINAIEYAIWGIKEMLGITW